MADRPATEPRWPSGYAVIWRNPGHYDVCQDRSRAFRIRGEPGDVRVADERDDPARPHPREWIKFRTVGAALTWCSDELMVKDGAYV